MSSEIFGVRPCLPPIGQESRPEPAYCTTQVGSTQELGIVNKPRLMKQTQSREFFGHHMLLNAAEMKIESAKQSEVGCFNNCLAAMTMTAIAVEALLNAVGSRVVKDWRTFERLKPPEKLIELQRELGFKLEPRENPWDTLHYLAGFRNDIVHAKPELVDEAKHFVEPAPTKLLFRKPPSKLEQKITVDNASRSLEAVQTLKGILTDALPVHLRFGIYVDAWSGSTEEAQ